MTESEIPVVIVGRSKQKYLGDRDTLVAANQRKSVYIAVLVLTVVALGLSLAIVASRRKEVYAFAIDKTGQEYVVSTPSKPISLRDGLLMDAAKQDLREWAEGYYGRIRESAESDYNRSRWFMDDALTTVSDAAARGKGGWLTTLLAGQGGECRIHVDGVVIRDADIQTQPFRAAIYLSKVFTDKHREKWRVDVRFYLNPRATPGPLPLFNAMGVFVTQVEENQIES